jgi:hypothetical protein
MEKLRRQIAIHVTAGLAAVLSACATGPQYVPVDIRDTGASAVSVRAEWHPRTQTTGSGGMEVKDGIEAQYVRMKGSDDQTLQTGQTLSIGGQSITGPTLVSHRLDISYAHIAYGGTAPVLSPDLELDAFMGAGRVDFDLRSSVTTPAPLTLRAKEVDYGLSMGLGVRWWFITSIGVEGRLIILTQNPLSFFGGTFGEGGQTDMLASELALVVRPGKHVALRGGYATMDLTPEKSSGSSLDFGLRGPFLGLGISF